MCMSVNKYKGYRLRNIRKTLCDTCRESRFIQTAHRRGYRFVANTKQSIACPAEKIPATRYARNGDIDIAYQVGG